MAVFREATRETNPQLRIEDSMDLIGVVNEDLGMTRVDNSVEQISES